MSRDVNKLSVTSIVDNSKQTQLVEEQKGKPIPLVLKTSKGAVIKSSKPAGSFVKNIERIKRTRRSSRNSKVFNEKSTPKVTVCQPVNTSTSRSLRDNQNEPPTLMKKLKSDRHIIYSGYHVNSLTFQKDQETLVRPMVACYDIKPVENSLNAEINTLTVFDNRETSYPKAFDFTKLLSVVLVLVNFIRIGVVRFHDFLGRDFLTHYQAKVDNKDFEIRERDHSLDADKSIAYTVPLTKNMELPHRSKPDLPASARFVFDPGIEYFLIL